MKELQIVVKVDKKTLEKGEDRDNNKPRVMVVSSIRVTELRSGQVRISYLNMMQIKIPQFLVGHMLQLETMIHSMALTFTSITFRNFLMHLMV
jgi:hypothetical protein